MGLASGPKDRTETIIKKVIEKVVERPKFVDVVIERPVYRDKIIEVPVIKEVEVIKEVVKIVEVEKIVSVPKYVHETVTVTNVKVHPVVVHDAKIVEKIVPVSKPEIRLTHMEEVVRVPKIVYDEEHRDIVVPVLKEKDIIVNRPKFVDKVVEVVKPKYICQNCGHEVR